MGNAANLHLAAAAPAITIPGSITIDPTGRATVTRIAGHFYLDDVIREPLRYVDGFLLVPDGPGLRMEMDPAKLERYRTG